MDKKLQKKIVFVNSFKGGAGKTTLSLSYCITELFDEYKKDKFENVFYLDLDILGTGLCYLFGDNKLTTENSFTRSRTPVKVLLGLETDGTQNELYIAHLDPGLKNRSSYGEIHFANHQGVADELFKNSVLELIDRCFEYDSALIIVDCAPGFSILEQKILYECYQKAVSSSIYVEEVYITTLDASHVKKCIHCLNDSFLSFGVKPETRNIILTVNDLQNFVSSLRQEGRDSEGCIQDILERIQSEINNSELDIYFWVYSSSIATRSIYNNQQKVENQISDYLLTKDNYKKM